MNFWIKNLSLKYLWNALCISLPASISLVSTLISLSFSLPAISLPLSTHILLLSPPANISLCLHPNSFFWEQGICGGLCVCVFVKVTNNVCVYQSQHALRILCAICLLLTSGRACRALYTRIISPCRKKLACMRGYATKQLIGVIIALFCAESTSSWLGMAISVHCKVPLSFRVTCLMTSGCSIARRLLTLSQLRLPNNVIAYGCNMLLLYNAFVAKHTLSTMSAAATVGRYVTLYAIVRSIDTIAVQCTVNLFLFKACVINFWEERSAWHQLYDLLFWDRCAQGLPPAW